VKGVTVDYRIMHAWWTQRDSFGISSEGLRLFNKKIAFLWIKLSCNYHLKFS